MNTVWQDLRYALRMLAKSPGFAAVAILTLAIGIGANTTIFSVVNAVLLQPLPFPEPQRLVAVTGTDVRNNERGRALSLPDFVDLRKQSRALESVAANTDASFTLTNLGDPLHVHAEVVSADMFTVLRAAPALGRTFLTTEDAPGTRVVILSNALWKGRFGADPNITDKRVRLDGQLYSVVGVMPPSFQFPLDAEPRDLWTTMAGEPGLVDTAPGDDKPMSEQRGAHFLNVIGRLAPGFTVQQANDDAAAVGVALEKQFPDTNGHLTFGLQPQIDALVGDLRPVLLMVLGAVAFLLLIACANTANLLLARAASRQREMAIRVSAGAGRARILRQLLTESLSLSLAGAALGLLMAFWGTQLFASMTDVRIPRLNAAHVDWRVLLFTLAVSFVTALLFGLAPAMHAMRFNLFASLKEGGRNATEGRGHSRLRSLLVISEVSLSVVLLVGASLLLESMLHLLHQSPGFEPHGLLSFNIDLPNERYGKPEQSILFYHQLLERLRVQPGVQQASGVFPLPLSNDGIRTTFKIAGRPMPESELPKTQFRGIATDYFQTMHIPVLAGRDFSARDVRGGAPVVIINDVLAREIFPNENPIGKRITPGIADSAEPLEREIVGVVGSVRYRSLWKEPDAESYIPYDQDAVAGLYMVLRTEGDPLRLVPAVRDQVKSLDPNLSVYATRTLDDYVSASLANRKFISILCGVFASAGLLLALVGLFGVMSYTVAQRTHELGVRTALGARKADILRLILGHGMAMTVAGIAVGVLAALAITRALSQELFGIKPGDPLTFLAVALVLAAVALAACYLPARRASRVDPMVALRYE
jgi:putative ABC transport system permease protein